MCSDFYENCRVCCGVGEEPLLERIDDHNVVFAETMEGSRANESPNGLGDDNNNGGVTIHYTTTGNISGIPAVQGFTFSDSAKAGLWMEQLGVLRREATAKSRGNPSRKDGLDWLQRFKKFHEEWGSEFVPEDMRRSVNHTQDSLGIVATVW